MGKDATETKLDDLLGQVTSIVEKQRVEELEKKRREERLKQKQWEQKHRLSSFRRRAHLPGPPDQDANDVGKSQTLATDDSRMMQVSSFQGHRRQSSADYTGHRPSIADLAARVSESMRHSGITDGRLDQGGRPTLADIGSRPSLSDHASRLAYLDSRRSSIGDHGAGGLSVFRQGSSSRYDRLERQRTLRSMSPVRFDGDQYGSSRYFRGHHSPSRYELDDPYVRSLSPVRYDQSARSPARSRQGSDPDIFGIISLSSSRREIPTRDLSSMLSPRYTDSRQTSPRGTMTFFPDTEPLPSYRGDQGAGEEFPPETVEGPAERETDADSVHSGDYGRYENRF